jgi:hypothetical protein
MSQLHRIVLVGLLVAAALTPVAALPQKAPAAADLLKAVGTYLENYATKVSGTTLDELFMLTEAAGGSMQVPERLSSDLVLLKLDVAGRLVGVRDPYSVDKKNLRPHDPRVTDVLQHATLESWSAVQGFARENAIYLRVNGVLWFSDPTLALAFVMTPNQPLMTYKVEGSKKINGVQVYGLGFTETERPEGAYVLGTPDRARASGRIWIDPASGAVHETDLWPESDTETARVHVTYTLEPTRSVLVPKEMTGRFEERERSSKSMTSGIGAQNVTARFDANVTYTNPRYVPIDLSRIAR